MIIQITKKYTGKLRLNIQLSIFGLFPNSILQLLTQFMGLGIGLGIQESGGKRGKEEAGAVFNSLYTMLCCMVQPPASRERKNSV